MSTGEGYHGIIKLCSGVKIDLDSRSIGHSDFIHRLEDDSDI